MNKSSTSPPIIVFPPKADDKAKLKQIRSQINRLIPDKEIPSDSRLEEVAEQLMPFFAERPNISSQQFQSLMDIKDKAFAEQFFNVFDADQSGFITLKEYLLGCLMLSPKADPKLKFRLIFDLWDADRSGKISYEEFRGVMKSCLIENNFKVKDEDFQRMVTNLFKVLDANGDETVEYHEFEKYMMDKHNQNKIGYGGANVETQLDLHRQEGFDLEENEAKNFQLPAIAPRKLNRFQLLIMTLYCDKKALFWLLIYLLINAFLFSLGAGLTTTEPVYQLLGGAIVAAKGARLCLYFNCAVLPLTMSRNTLTYLRQVRFLGKILPFDHHIAQHKLMAWVILFFSIVHTAAHYYDFWKISVSSSDDIEKYMGVRLDPVPNWPGLAFLSIPGATGHLLWLVMLIMYVTAQEFFRRRWFEVFWYPHHLFIIFYALLLIHGAAMLAPLIKSAPFPAFWWWFVVPGTIYFLERLARVVRSMRDTSIVVAQQKPSKVTALTIKRPPQFKYKSGQYVFVRCPKLAYFQWHPFTLTSSPREQHLSVHIRSAGNWTSPLYELMAKEPYARFDVDGPYGAASEDVYQFKTVILVGAGIGVTPFASILKDIKLRKDEGKAMKLQKVYFIWINQDQQAFEWFAALLGEVTDHDPKNPFIRVRTYLTRAQNKNDIRSFMLWEGMDDDFEANNRDMVTGLAARTYWGRPDFNSFFQYLSNKHAGRRLGLFVCGPVPLCTQLYQLCKQFSKVGGTRFVFNKENF